jgi:WD40 repeat protein
MGVVYKARHLALNRIVALKMIRAGSDAGPELRARFEAESEAVARLQHPNIVQIYEVGDADGCPFCALEFVEGGSLAEKLARTPLSPRDAAELVQTLAGGMEAAHAKWVVHRDLKPANVLLTADGVPKVTDFGLAKLMGEESGQTQTGSILGTPSYMAPEQAEGRVHAIGPVTDVYALGAILYECLTGRPPFKGASMMETLEQVRRREPVPPSQLQPTVPRDLETVCLKCLHKEPGKRYASAAALAEDLCRFLAGEPVLARPVGRLGRGWRWCRRNPVLAVVGTFALVVLLAGSVVSAYFAIQSGQNAGYFKKEFERAQTEFNRAEGLYVKEQAATKEAQEQTKFAVAQKNVAEKRLTNSEWLVYISSLREAHLEWDRDNFPVALLRLNECRLGFRGWEHDYLWTLFHSNQRNLSGHDDVVVSVAYSADGKYVASAANRPSDRVDNPEGGEVKVWDPDRGQLLHTLRAGAVGLCCLAFTPDGKQIVCLNKRTDPNKKVTKRELKVWDAATGKVVRTLSFPTGFAVCVALSPDGKHVALARDDGEAAVPVKVVDATTGETVHSLKGKITMVYGMAFSPDGKRLAACGDITDADTGKQKGVVEVWELAGEREVLALEEKGISLYGCVAFSPGGKEIVAGNWHNTISVWDAASGRPLRTLAGHTWSVNGLAFSRDGRRLVSAGADSTVRVWDFAGGKLVNTLRGHVGDANGVALGPDGKRVVSGGGEWHKKGEVKLWEADVVQEPLSLAGHKDDVLSVSFARDGKLLATGGADHAVKLWDATTGRNTQTFAGDSEGEMFQIKRVAFTPDGKHLACSGRRMTPQGLGKGLVNLLDVKTGATALAVQEPTGEIAFTVSPDGKRLVTAQDQEGVLHQWDAATGRSIVTSSEMRHWFVQSLEVSPDGKRIASGGGGSEGTLEKPDWHGEVKVWDVATGECLLTLRGHKQLVTAVAYSPDGKLLASGSQDNMVRVWDAATGRLIHTLRDHTEALASVAFSPDGERLASAGQDRTVRLWDVASGHLTFTLRGHGSAITSVTFSADGKRLATASEDHTARVWDAGSGERLVDPDDPRSAPARYAALGVGLALKGDPAKAAAAFAEGLDRTADASGKAAVIREAAEYEQAFAALLQLRPREPQLVAAEAIRLADRGRKQEAAETRERARSLFEARMKERPDDKSLADAYAAFLRETEAVGDPPR